MGVKKERLSGLFCLIILTIISIQFVSAYYSYFDMRTEVNRLIQLVIDFTEPFLQVIFGGDYWNGQLLFEKFLLFIILVSVVYIAMSKAPFFQKNGEPIKGVLWTVSIVVPILSIRYMPYEWVNTVIFTYAAFGIAVTTIIPLIIYFFFLQGLGDIPPAIRKIAWILFACVYLGLYTTTDKANYSEWYFATAVIAVVFLLLDGTIQRYFMKQKWAAAEVNSQSEALVNITARIEKIQEDTSLPQDRKDALLRKLNKDKEQILKGVFMKWR